MEGVSKKGMCYVCEKESDQGIYVLGKFLCTDCQNKLINLSPIDEDYNFYRSKMIDIWKDYMNNIKYENQI